MGEIGRRQRAGRKRKQGVTRYRDGQIATAEREREVVSVAVEARKRHHGATDANARHAEWGDSLGILLKTGQIDERQRAAGDHWIRVYMRYRRLKGLGSPNPKIAAYAAMIAGMSHEQDVEDDVVIKAQREFLDLQRAIQDDCRHEGIDRINNAIRRVLVEQADPKHIRPNELANLRMVLNSIARHLRLA
jgi:hypothetical protein